MDEKIESYSQNRFPLSFSNTLKQMKFCRTTRNNKRWAIISDEILFVPEAPLDALHSGWKKIYSLRKICHESCCCSAHRQDFVMKLKRENHCRMTIYRSTQLTPSVNRRLPRLAAIDIDTSPDKKFHFRSTRHIAEWIYGDLETWGTSWLVFEAKHVCGCLCCSKVTRTSLKFRAFNQEFIARLRPE